MNKKISKNIGEQLKAFKHNLAKYAGYYNPGALFEKIKKFAKKAGRQTVYVVLVLYYATFDKALPRKDRLMVLAALGYFILPLDFIPDAIPGGFLDDAGALMYVLKHIWNNLSDETFRKAKHRLHEWFDEDEEDDKKILKQIEARVAHEIE